MRPGPGLVVMALAFISGARRGSTSSKISSSSTTSSTTSSSSSSSSSTFNSNSNSYYSLSSSSSSPSSSSSDTFASSTTSHSSTLFPTFLAGGGVLTSTGEPSPPPFPTSSDYNYYYHNNYPQPPFKLPDKLRQQYDDPRVKSELLTPVTSSSRATRETRAARNTNSAAVENDRNSDIVARAGGGDNSNVNGNGFVSDNDNDDNSSSSSSSNSDSSDGSASEGLFVQFPSHSADSSTSFDEDDILALVVEDDLLSEESFDRLTKLTDDKIGYINEEGYGGVEFGEVSAGTGEAIEVGGVTAGVSGGGGGTVADDDESGAVSNRKSSSGSQSSVVPADVSETAQELHQDDEARTDRIVIAPIGLDGGDTAAVVDSGGSSSADTTSYVANLVTNNGATLSDSTTNRAQQSSNDAAKFDVKRIGLNSPVFDSTSSLTRINPWLSACDLAQPSTAPDLQGQCQAGTLPVAWVDEGPGPPSCPKSCEQIRLENNKNKNNFNYNSNNSNNNKNINDNNKYLIDTNLINSKPNQLIIDRNNNNNNNNNNNINNSNNNIMSKVRRQDVNYSKNDNEKSNGDTGTLNTAAPTRKATAIAAAPAAAVTTTTTTSKSDKATKQQKLQLQQQQEQEQLEMQQDDGANDLSYVVDDKTTISQNNNNNNRNSNNNNNNSNNSNNKNNNRQSQNNNNIVKSNTNVNVNLNSYDLKYNNLINQEQPNSRSSGSSGSSSSNHNYNTFKQQQQHKPQSNRKYQQQQQQCLDYLGDNEESSPQYICQLESPSVMAFRLRSLRLRHCCERNVFSALHTIALNATLGGGTKCVRVLTDIMELDSLATRITCELAEILYRFDCRQVYSLINQCDDCKEAYRRWVCSTLIPFFAEQNDTLIIPSKNSSSNNTSENNNNSTTTTITSNSTNNNKLTFKPTVKRSLTNNVENLYKNDNIKNFNVNNVHNKVNQVNLIQNNNNNNNNDNKNMKYYLNFNKRSERRISRSTTSLARSAVAAFYDAIDSNRNIDKEVDIDINSSRKSNNFGNFIKNTRDADGRCIRKSSNQQQEHQQQQQQAQDDQHNNFISTATNKDPCVEDPVISKLLKRSKRKIEFRKRRRIRPCLSVCQIVEQKCPYLLPADRAPALPTQYAGEPTFLCLDPNIDETGEQLRKSNHGLPDCCYTYCPQPVHGVCTYCKAFTQTGEDDTSINKNVMTTANGTNTNTSPSPTRRIHNITLTTTSVSNRTNDRSASVAIALLNISTIRSDQDLERLPYYAYFEGNYFYDYIDEMPHEALAECSPVPSVTTRCTIPYYASSAMSQRSKSRNGFAMRSLLLCLSAMLCLINSYYVIEIYRTKADSSGSVGADADGRRHFNMPRHMERGDRTKYICVRKRRRRDKFIGVRSKRKNSIIRHHNGSNIEQESSSSSRKQSSSQRRRRRRISHNSNKLRKCKILNRNNIIIMIIIANNYYEYSKFRQVNSNSSQGRCSKNSSKYSSKISTKINTNNNNMKNNSFNKNYRFHYFYNFNINDLWRRWWIRSRDRNALSSPSSLGSLHDPTRQQTTAIKQMLRTTMTTTS